MHHSADELGDGRPRGGIVDAARPVAEGRPEIDRFRLSRSSHDRSTGDSTFAIDTVLALGSQQDVDATRVDVIPAFIRACCSAYSACPVACASDASVGTWPQPPS
jgi:hypothetical protein